jgi:predicted nucleic acid-binding protein
MDAIIDNTVLVNFFDSANSKYLPQLRNIFRNLYISEAILAEFLNIPPKFLQKRQEFADKIQISQGFFRLCNTYDSIVLGLLKTVKGVDEGEAESIAQASKRNIPVFLTDDRACSKYMAQAYPHIKCYNTLFVIALLDINDYLQNPEQVWVDMHRQCNFNREDVVKAFEQSCSFLGLKPNKKLIRNRCYSIKQVL